MILDENLAALAKSRKGRYLLVNVIMRRTRDLYEGAKPLVKTPETKDAGTIAHSEIVNDRLKVTPRKVPLKLVDLAKQNV